MRNKRGEILKNKQIGFVLAGYERFKRASESEKESTYIFNQGVISKVRIVRVI